MRFHRSEVCISHGGLGNFFKVSIETNTLRNKNNGIFIKVSQFLSTSSDPVDSTLTIFFTEA